MIFNAPEYISPGTIKKSPPIPKYPDAKPTNNPLVKINIYKYFDEFFKLSKIYFLEFHYF